LFSTLARSGFEVTPNRLLVGRCVEHEVDAIAKKDGITFFVEAKHHSMYHTLTGLDRVVLLDGLGRCHRRIAMGKSDSRLTEL